MTRTIVAIAMSALLAPLVIVPAYGQTNYGPLGKPIAADIGELASHTAMSPALLLDLFRFNQGTPPKEIGDPNMAKRWLAQVDFFSLQRALFYPAIDQNPRLASQGDWKAIRGEEDILMLYTCGELPPAVRRYHVSQAQCDVWLKTQSPDAKKVVDRLRAAIAKAQRH
jgi:hypothetical protein